MLLRVRGSAFSAVSFRNSSSSAFSRPNLDWSSLSSWDCFSTSFLVSSRSLAQAHLHFSVLGLWWDFLRLGFESEVRFVAWFGVGDFAGSVFGALAVVFIGFAVILGVLVAVVEGDGILVLWRVRRLVGVRLSGEADNWFREGKGLVVVLRDLSFVFDLLVVTSLLQSVHLYFQQLFVVLDV